MRVLMISDVHFPRINGVSTSIESFRQALAELGVSVTVVAPAYAQKHHDDAGIVRVPARRVPFDPEDRLMRPVKLSRALASHRDVDLVHIQTPFAAHYAGLRHARRLGAPCLATYHTHFEEYLHHYLPALPKNLLSACARTLARRQCNALDAVIVPSEAMRATLLAYGVTTPLYRVPTGIPLAHFQSDAVAPRRAARAEFRARFAIPDAAPVALYVGRAAFEKNIGFLLEALQHALVQRPELILVIAGEGPALPALREQAAHLGIALAGALRRLSRPPARIAGLLVPAADVFVFASRTETQGLVLLEAMAAACPCWPFSLLGHARDRRAAPRRAASAPGGRRLSPPRSTALIDAPRRRAAMAREGRAFAAAWRIEAWPLRLAKVYRHVLARRACHHGATVSS
jgi:1,2-diacylglycerol 3-alpha-glucosyltransferase